MSTEKKAKNPSIWAPVIMVGIISTGMSAGMFYMLDKKRVGGVVEAAPVVIEAPRYVEIKPFTINILSSERRQRMLYAGVTIKVADEQTHTFLEGRKREIRSRLIQMMSESNTEEIVTPEGKDELNKKIMGIFDKPFTENQPLLQLTEILFTDFIVQ